MKILTVILFVLTSLTIHAQQTKGSCGSCESEIAVTFEDCNCFSVTSCKDISHIELVYNGIKEKVEAINGRELQYCGTSALDGVIIKSGCSEYLFENTACSLPAEIVSFAGNIQGGQTSISFEVKSLSNVRFFLVQASVTGFAWDNQDMIKPDGIRTYTTEFQNIYIEPVVYYRILTLDYDDSFEVTKVIALDNDQRAFPANVTFTDLSGRVYTEKPKGFSVARGKGRTTKKITIY